MNQKVILGLLAESGIEIVVADDGQIALDILEKENNFSVVLMDAHMPNVDGFEATRKIRANPRYDHLVVVALSGDTASDDIKKMKEAGMQEHLEKPLKMDALYDILYKYHTTPLPQEEKVEDISHNTQEALFDPQQGLTISGGDHSFYDEILQEFLQTYNDSAQQLQKLINAKNLNEADAHLIDISGTAANIGATSLHKVTQEFKSALHDRASNLNELFQNYYKTLQKTLQEIQDYLASK